MADIDIKGIKDAIEASAKAFEDFKKVNDERIEAIKTGQATGEIEAKLVKIQSDLEKHQDVKARLDKIETALKRGPAPKDSKGNELSDDEVKQRDAVHAYLRKGDEKQISECKDLSVHSDPDGGYFVHADMSGRMIGRIFETSPLRQLASVQPISTDALEDMVDDGDAGAEWVGETVPPADTTTPQVRKWRIPVHEMATRPKATQKLLEDTAVNIETWLLGKVTSKFAREENTQFVLGNGVAKPRGFLTYPAAANADLYQYATIGQFVSAAAGTLDADALIDLTTGLKAEYLAKAVLVANRISWRTARKLVDTVGQYLWQPSLQMGMPSTFNGIPTADFNDMPTIAAGALSFAIADWAEAYQIVDRVGLAVLRDPYTAKPFVEFYCRRRVGGDVVNFDAIKILKIHA